MQLLYSLWLMKTKKKFSDQAPQQKSKLVTLEIIVYSKTTFGQ